MRTISYLYKYRPVGEFTEKIFTDNALYYGRAADFNDPFDSNLVLDLNFTPDEERQIITEAARSNGIPEAAALERLAKFRGAAKEEWKRHICAFVDRLRRESSICCFATRPDNSLMFAHYAGDHHGMCLQFSPGARERLGIPLRVDYGAKLPELRYAQLRGKLDGALMKSLFLWKHEDWAYEDEWRVVRLHVPAGPVRFHPADLTGVMFGHRATAETRQKIRECVAKGGSNPLFYQARVDRTLAELVLERI